jgi:hypothetical protein
MDCERVKELHALYALGELDPTERADLEVHLRARERHDCHALVEQSQLAVEKLPLALPPLHLGEDAWQELAARLGLEAAPAAGPVDAAAPRVLRAPRAPRAPLAPRAAVRGLPPVEHPTLDTHLRAPGAFALDVASDAPWRDRLRWAGGAALLTATASFLVAAVLWPRAGGDVTPPRTGAGPAGGSGLPVTAGPVDLGVSVDPQALALVADLTALLSESDHVVIPFLPSPGSPASAAAVHSTAGPAPVVVVVTHIDPRPGFALQVLLERQGGALTILDPNLHPLGAGTWLGSFDPSALRPPDPTRLLLRRIASAPSPSPPELLLTAPLPAR